MNIQSFFEALENEPTANRLNAAIRELIRQGFRVSIEDKFYFESDFVVLADETFRSLDARKGLLFSIENQGIRQSFRIHFPSRNIVAIGSTVPMELIPHPDSLDLPSSPN